jgi:hypothetical protein
MANRKIGVESGKDVRKLEALKATLRHIVGLRGKGEFSIAFDSSELQIVRVTKENVGEVAERLAQ